MQAVVRKRGTRAGKEDVKKCPRSSTWFLWPFYVWSNFITMRAWNSGKYWGPEYPGSNPVLPFTTMWPRTAQRISQESTQEFPEDISFLICNCSGGIRGGRGYCMVAKTPCGREQNKGPWHQLDANSNSVPLCVTRYITEHILSIPEPVSCL